jgi:hypothetical protein
MENAGIKIAHENVDNKGTKVEVRSDPKVEAKVESKRDIK